MLINDVLPQYDATAVHEIRVAATPAMTWRAIRETDLRDPVVDALFAVRELPNRLRRRWRGEPPPPAPAAWTFADLATPAMGWVLLGEAPGVEFVVGAVGRFWQGDYGWRPTPASAFTAFAEPGYAKIAVSFRVQPASHGGALLRYEARTATTDADAHRRFRRYWRVIHPGVAIVMHRALVRIRDEAERCQRAQVVAR